jgi:arylsulfatase
MTDQQRFDTIAALGNPHIHTPNLDRLVARGATFANGYSTCPVCMPARYALMSGCEPPSTGVWANMLYPDMHRAIERHCGRYLPQALRDLGYRTFGIGKFHTVPWDAPLGFDTQLHGEEMYDDAEQRSRDAYVAFIAREHPEYAWVEALMGERTEMYYMPQRSPLPAELTIESWAVDRAIELTQLEADRPWFGFVSFVGPHPPFAPPQPFNRLYDPDRMPDPVCGDRALDHRDQQIPLSNRLIWADGINDSHARVLKARYYGEITYIDWCVGRLLDAIEASAAAENTLICFFSDHGEHLGDHGAWQKESFFEASTRVPFLVSWPRRIAPGERSGLACLTDLFGLATAAAGRAELRQGVDLLSVLERREAGRGTLFGYFGVPGTHDFKLMVRQGQWKLIYFANGGQSQLFDLWADPLELHDLSDSEKEMRNSLAAGGAAQLARAGCVEALQGGRLRALPYKSWETRLAESPYREHCPTGRFHQFDVATGMQRFPAHPREVLGRFTGRGRPARRT